MKIEEPAWDFEGELLAQAARERSEGRFDEALRICRRGLEKKPSSLEGRLALGECLLAAGELSAARRELERVAQQVEAVRPVFVSLAEAYRKMGEEEKSLGSLRKALLFFPADSELKKKAADLERALMVRRKRPAPEEEGERDRVIIPTDTLAEIYLRQSRPEKALAVYEEILSRDPGHEEARRKAQVLKRKMNLKTRAPAGDVRPTLERWLAALAKKAGRSERAEGRN